MINGIGPTGSGRVDSTPAKRLEAVSRPADVRPTADAAAPNPAAELAAAGPPVDIDKVSRIRAGLADGSYKIDAGAIADRMIALDLPGKA